MWAVLDLEADPCVLSPYAVHKGGYVYVKHYVHQRGNKPNPFGVSALARKFGVDTGTIYNILKRKTHL